MARLSRERMARAVRKVYGWEVEAKDLYVDPSLKTMLFAMGGLYVGRFSATHLILDRRGERQGKVRLSQVEAPS